MGLSEKLTGKHVYFDTNIFIYALEAPERYAVQTASLAQLLQGESCTVFTSELTLAELLTKPLRDGRMEAVAIYRDALENSSIRLAPISRAVLIRAAMLRGQLGMKTPDAIHAATAVDSACSAFLTNDAELRVPKSIERVLFSEG
jgi:predicted nucleic acid-binding protein